MKLRDIATELVPRKMLQRLGRYAIIEPLATGGMAQLYLARRDGDRELCVLKRLLIEYEKDEIASKRFQREAHVSSYLNHPSIVRTLDAGFESGVFCIATELIAGQTLDAMLEKLRAQNRVFPPELTIPIILAVLDALAYAHDLRDTEGRPLELVHRDLSPRNIIVSYSGEVKLIDFGVARGKVDDFKTAPGVVVGSLEYMSPEQAVAQPVDRRSDLYTISVVLYEMLTGRFVTPRDDKLMELLSSIVRDVPPPLSAANPNLPDALDPVMAKALAKSPDDRYQTAQELKEALNTALAGLIFAPPSATVQFLRELLPEEEQKVIQLIERGRRSIEEAFQDAARLPDEQTRLENMAKYEPTALVERPRARLGQRDRVKKVPDTLGTPTVAGLDDGPPPENTGLGGIVLEMPGDQVPLSRTTFEYLKRSNKRLRFLLIGLGGIAVIMLTAVLLNSRRTGADGAPLTTSSPSPVVAHAQVKVGARQGTATDTEAVDESAAARVEVAPQKTRAASDRPRKRSNSTESAAPQKAIEERTAPPEKVAAVAEAQKPAETPAKTISAPYADLRQRLKDLRSSPNKDSKKYYALLEGIEAAAANIPSAAKRNLTSDLRSAELTYDVEMLAHALEELIKLKASSK